MIPILTTEARLLFQLSDIKNSAKTNTFLYRYEMESLYVYIMV